MAMTRLQSKKRKMEDKIDVKGDLMDIVEQVYTGEFFMIPDINISGRKSDIKRVYHSLERIRSHFIHSIPNVIDIAEGDYPLELKHQLLEKIHILTICDVGSFEYQSAFTFLKNIKNPSVTSQNILDEINTTPHNKLIIEKMIKSSINCGQEEGEKYKIWINNALSIPFGKYSASEIDIQKIRNSLDVDLAYMEEPKDRIINMFAKLQRNSASKINAILLHGSKGTGKTAISKSIANALGRPFKKLPLAGASDPAVLNGHSFTYTGAIPGRIISLLSEAKCMDAVVLLDEVDKLSQTQHGMDIIGTLIHLTDTTTNNEYSQDRYFSGLEFDLSRVLFIFTANDISLINPILLDRLFKIHVKSYDKSQELMICKNFILPKIMNEFRFTDEIQISDKVLQKVISITKKESGLREVGQALDLIIERINTLKHHSGIVKLGYNTLENYYSCNSIVLPEHVEVLLGDFIQKQQTLSMYM